MVANETQISKIVKYRPRRTFSLEDKQKFYAQWKKSGLSRNKFCKEKDLVHSAFANWCKIFSSGQTAKNKNDWVPVVGKKQSSNANCLQIQIKLPTTSKRWIFLLFLILTFMVLSHAVAIIW